MKKAFLASILFLSFVLRVWGLDKVPPELFGDELDVGYQSYSLLKTGRDYYGQLLPFYIHSFSEWRAPLLMYATVPFVGLFGLNEWGVRLPSAIFGTISVFIFYLLVKKLLNKEGLSLIAALFLATSPWHLQYSRMAFELSLLLFIFLLAIYLFFLSFSKNTLLVISFILFGLTLYTYNTANLLMPLLVFLLVCLYRHDFFNINRKIIILSLGLMILISIPIGKDILFGKAAERFSTFSVFGHEEYLEEINSKRSVAGNNLFERIAHNKPLLWARVVGLNYLSAFSPTFLLERGDVTFRHSVHEMGVIFWPQFILFLYGIFHLITKVEKKTRNFWIGWLLIAPIPASLTWDGANHASRLFLLIPPLTFISSLGFYSLRKLGINRVLKTLLISFFTVWFLVGFAFYLHRYWVHYPVESWRWWQVGYKEAINFMKQKEDSYKAVVFNNTYEPSLIRFLFWWQYSPPHFFESFKGDKQVKNIINGFNGFTLIDRYYFGSAEGRVENFLNKRMIYLVSQKDEVGGNWDWEKSPPKDVEVLKTVRNPYGEPIFYIVTKSNP